MYKLQLVSSCFWVYVFQKLICNLAKYFAIENMNLESYKIQKVKIESSLSASISTKIKNWTE